MLQARFHRPNTCSDVVLRERLFKRLSTNLDNPLTVISAPAGSGKTTLVTSWLDEMAAGDSESASFGTAWLAADATLDDRPLFFAALIAAIENAFPNACAEARELLQSGTQIAWAHFAAMLTESCLLLPRKLIIIDDYYLITNSAVHEALSQLIGAWHQAVHLIIVTRVHPPLGLPRLRARNQLCEILYHDLQFDAGEVSAFMRAAVKTDYSLDFVDTLQKCTEGWAAGVRLATLSLQ